MGNVFHKSGAVSNRRPAKTKESPSQGKEVEFVRGIVEELVNNVPQKSETVRRESNTGSSLSSTDCFTDIIQGEDSRKSQDTEPDVTEYESAADTDFSDKLASSSSLLTFSEQRLEDIEDESICSFPTTPVSVENSLNVGIKEEDVVEPKNIVSNNDCHVEEKVETEASHITKLPHLTSESHEELVLPITGNSSEICELETEDNFSATLETSNNFSADNVNCDKSVNSCPTSGHEELNELVLPHEEKSFDDSHVEKSTSLPFDTDNLNKCSATSVPLDECATVTPSNVQHEANIIVPPSLDECATVTPSNVQHEANIIVPPSKEESLNNVLSEKDIDLLSNLENENKYVTLDKCKNLSVVSELCEPNVFIIPTESISPKVTSDPLIQDPPVKLQGSFSPEEHYDQSADERHIVLDLQCKETVPRLEHSCDNSDVIHEVASENFSFVSEEASKVAQEIFDAFGTLDDIDEDSVSLKMSSASNLETHEKDLNMKANEATNSINDDFYHEDSLRSTHKLSNSPQPKSEKDDDTLGSITETEKNVYLRTSDTGHVAEACKAKDSSAALRSAQSGTVSKDAVLYDILSTKGSIKSGQDTRRGNVQSEPEKSLLEDSVSLKGAIDENDNSRKSDDEKTSAPAKNQALEFINKLLSQSVLLKSSSSNNGNQTAQKVPNNSVPDIPRDEVQHVQEQLLQLRDVIYEQDAIFKEEIKKCQSRMKNVEEREHQLARRMSENSLGQQQMSLILEEYEKTISRLVAEKEHERQAFDMEKETLIKEKDTISGHLSNIEIAFSDVHQKYEKSKQVIQGFKNNEEALRATVSEYEAALKKQEQKYEILKSHAMGQLESANQELIAMRRNHEAENSKLKAMLKKAEVKIHSLEETLQQKVKENQELVNICDELIGKVGSSE